MPDRNDILRAYRPIQSRTPRLEPDCLMLELERIGTADPFVNEIYGHQPGEFIKRPVKGLVDYSASNGVGTRGVRRFFYLTANHIYEVSDPQSWTRTEHYYCRVRNGQVIRMNVGEVFSWLRSNVPLG
jgi:hypothetical protein